MKNAVTRSKMSFGLVSFYYFV